MPIVKAIQSAIIKLQVKKKTNRKVKGESYEQGIL